MQFTQTRTTSSSLPGYVNAHAEHVRHVPHLLHRQGKCSGDSYAVAHLVHGCSTAKFLGAVHFGHVFASSQSASRSLASAPHDIYSFWKFLHDQGTLPAASPRPVCHATQWCPIAMPHATA